MVEGLESELVGALKETSNTDNPTVAEEANFYEAITEGFRAINEIKDQIL